MTKKEQNKPQTGNVYSATAIIWRARWHCYSRLLLKRVALLLTLSFKQVALHEKQMTNTSCINYFRQSAFHIQMTVGSVVGLLAGLQRWIPVLMQRCARNATAYALM